MANLWWGMLAGAVLVLVGVTALWIHAWLRTPRRFAAERARAVEARWILWGGIVLPAVGIGLLLGFGLPLGQRIAPQNDPGALRIEVTGHQWWWEIRYPDSGVITANRLLLPAGRPVEVRVTSADVIHSFWVPGLGGKVDMIPGHENRVRLFADAPGTWRGQCAEFCGSQHARMILAVEARTPDEFHRWLAARQPPPFVARGSGDSQAAAVGEFRAHCGHCHRVAGVSDGGRGPDLGDLGSRPTLGAGTLPMTPGATHHWLRQHQQLKAGNRMPVHADIPPAVLQRVAGWLETLDP